MEPQRLYLYIAVSLCALSSLTLGAHIDIKGITKKSKPNVQGKLTYSDLNFILNSRNGVTENPEVVLSPCARAILGCCKDNKINERCSEALKCGAFFFDDNPCDEKFIVSALKAARQFYEQYNIVMTT